mmetsp:Transcript_13957/g.35958  ORF Transcript_13957/g.35958 Transcript_13957/m.35958 type:complete len:90 (-) Transcript_13957:1695-1964(-)
MEKKSICTCKCEEKYTARVCVYNMSIPRRLQRERNAEMHSAEREEVKGRNKKKENERGHAYAHRHHTILQSLFLHLTFTIKLNIIHVAG